MKKFLLLLLLVFSISIHADRAYQKGLKAYQSAQYSTALKYFYISARRHNVNAYTELGLMHEHGIGTSASLATAFYWYEKAARRNSPAAQYHLATMYEQGKWVKKDMKQAQFWYRRAARNGNNKAKMRLAGKQPTATTAQPTVTSKKKQLATTARPAAKQAQSGITNSFIFWKRKPSETTAVATQPAARLEKKQPGTTTPQPTAKKEEAGIMDSLTFWK